MFMDDDDILPSGGSSARLLSYDIKWQPWPSWREQLFIFALSFIEKKNSKIRVFVVYLTIKRKFTA